MRNERWAGFALAPIAGGLAGFGHSVEAVAAAAIVLVVIALLLSPAESAVAGCLAGVIATAPTVLAAVGVAPLSFTEWTSAALCVAIWAAGAAAMSFVRRRSVWGFIPLAFLCALFAFGSLPSLEHKLDPVSRSSVYISMPDGVKIAADVYLPRALRAGQTLPTVFRQVRYYRSLAIRWPFNIWADKVPDILNQVVAKHRYAAVVTDVRGSGASFGTRNQEWSPQEIRDGSAVVDWIVRQPWSNGRVGTVGGSYDGASAEFLVSMRNPALKAAIVMSSPFDAYGDLLFPGGINLASFTDQWTPSVRVLDLNEVPEMSDRWLIRLGLLGINPVDGDWNDLRAAIREHRSNYDGTTFVRSIVFRDDRSSNGLRIDAMSPYRRMDAERSAAIPIYSVSGWFDGGYSGAAIARWVNLPAHGSRLLLGPWDHSRAHDMDPIQAAPHFDILAEMFRFFDRYLKGERNGIDDEPPVKYYTIGAGWYAASTWPPTGIRRVEYYFGSRHDLVARDVPRATDDVYRVNNGATTGTRSRWDSLTGPWATYENREREDTRLLVYQTPALARDVNVTGTPVVTIRIGADTRDAEVFAYLEDVDERGHVFYVTEGQLRALDRNVSSARPPYRDDAPYHTFLRRDAQPLRPGTPATLEFGMLPVSWQFHKGHAIRIALAGADADHFAMISHHPDTLRVYEGGTAGSSLDLPVLDAKR